MSVHSRTNSGSGYDRDMVNPQAAVMVLDHVPDSEELSDLATIHLEDFPSEEAHATCEIVYDPPEWLEVHERDQMSAFLRDGAACILIIYMQAGRADDLEGEETDDDL